MARPQPVFYNHLGRAYTQQVVRYGLKLTKAEDDAAREYGDMICVLLLDYLDDTSRAFNFDIEIGDSGSIISFDLLAQDDRPAVRHALAASLESYLKNAKREVNR